MKLWMHWWSRVESSHITNTFQWNVKWRYYHCALRKYRRRWRYSREQLASVKTIKFKIFSCGNSLESRNRLRNHALTRISSRRPRNFHTYDVLVLSVEWNTGMETKRLAHIHQHLKLLWSDSLAKNEINFYLSASDSNRLMNGQKWHFISISYHVSFLWMFSCKVFMIFQHSVAYDLRR